MDIFEQPLIRLIFIVFLAGAALYCGLGWLGPWLYSARSDFAPVLGMLVTFVIMPIALVLLCQWGIKEWQSLDKPKEN